MSQTKAEYAELPEFLDIARKLIKKHPDVFGPVDVSLIQCVAIMNKPRKEEAQEIKIVSVPMPIRMNCPYAYYITLHNEDWVDRDEVHRQYLVAEALMYIDPEEEGKIRKPDAQYFNVMLRTFGPDHQEKPVLPDLLSETIKWVK